MRKQDPSTNSLKHGCCSGYVRLLAGETQADYDHLASTWLKKYFPSDDAQIELVQDLIDAAWQKRRSQRNFEDVQQKLFAQNPDQITWTSEQLRVFNLAKRYKTADINTFSKAQKAIEHLQKNDHERVLRIEDMVTRRSKESELSASDRKFNNDTRGLFRARPEIPTLRHDGGCPCAICLYRLGVERYFATDTTEQRSS